MYKLILLTITGGLFLMGCSEKNPNPFYNDYDTPFKTPPFAEIKMEHYLPAFEDGIAREKEEIIAIATNTEAPTFINTIAAMEKTGELLEKVRNVFYNLKSSNTNDEMQEIAKKLSPMLSKHRDDILLNNQLFCTN